MVSNDRLGAGEGGKQGREEDIFREGENKTTIY